MRFVPMQLVQPGMIVGRDIISRSKAKMAVKGAVLTAENIEHLCASGYIGIYISDLVSEEVDINEPISEDVFREGVDAIAEQNVGHILNVSTEIVREISNQKNLSVDLIDLRSFDDYTYHHSVNVAVYAVAVGKKMGLSEKEISNLSQAAICHDLGKMKIPEEILNKPDKLTDEEYEIVKEHPRKSWEILSKSPEISAVVKQAVLMHHENENGSGYPLHKEGSELSILTKIIHAVDVYDALTSKRPYKEPYAPVVAFDYLKGGCDILFDKRVVDAMIQVIPAFPPGTDVKLSDGRIGVVIGHTTDALRPIVKIIEDESVINLSLIENKDILIVESGVMISDYSEEVELLNETRNKPVNVKPKVLIVDDMMISLKQTKAALGEDYKVSLASSGLEALNMIKEEGAPDLIIVDFDMPIMDGVSLVKKIKEKGISDVPIIFLTSSADRLTVLKCLAVGATDYIVKPAKPVYLRERVAYALKDQRE